MTKLSKDALLGYFQFAKGLSEAGIQKPRISWDIDSYAMEWHKDKSHHVVLKVDTEQLSSLAVRLPSGGSARTAPHESICLELEALFDSGQLDWMKDD
jgi:hypothetical protein